MIKKVAMCARCTQCAVPHFLTEHGSREHPNFCPFGKCAVQTTSSPHYAAVIIILLALNAQTVVGKSLSSLGASQQLGAFWQWGVCVFLCIPVCMCVCATQRV
jgi:hypothetical protein